MIQKIDGFWRRRKVRPIIQNDLAECGIACVAMIANFYGCSLELSHLRAKFEPPLLGTKLTTLLAIANELGLDSTPLQVEVSELAHIQAPAILHLKMGHYLVLTGVGRNDVVVVDPAVGERRIPNEELERIFSRIVVELSPRENFVALKNAPTKSVHWLSVASNVRGVRGGLYRSLGLAFILESLVLAQPVITQVTIDTISNYASIRAVVIFSLALFVLSALSAFVSAMRSWVIALIQNNLFSATSARIFRHLLALPQSYFERRRLGDIVARFNTVGGVQQIISVRLVEVVLDGIVSTLTLLVLSILYGKWFAAIPLCALAAYIVLKAVLFDRYTGAASRKLQYQSRLQHRLIEGVRLSQTIRLGNLQDTMGRRYSDLGYEAVAASMDAHKLDVLSQVGASLLSGIDKAVVFGLGAYLVLCNRLSVGALFAVFFLCSQFTLRSRSFVDHVLQVLLLRVQRSRLSDIVEAQEEKGLFTEYAGSIEITSIDVKAVSFRYSAQDPWLLVNINLKVEPGELVIVTGPSGCGKTTLLRLILGMLTPSQGEVQAGNVPIYKLGLHKYRENLGISFQDSEIFSGTVFENISMFDDGATLTDVESLAKMFYLHDDVVKMPMGYNTQVAGVDSHLSGGQKQKILLARALYRRPKILILDEATCHIDIPTETKILSNLRNSKIAVLMVTHRMATTQHACRVYNLRTGVLFDKAEIPESAPL